MSEEIDISDFTLLDGIGPTIKKELKQGGFETITEIAACIPDELIERLKYSEDKSIKVIDAANQYLQENNLIENNIMTGLEDLKRRESLQRIDLNSKALNGLLDGGVETGAITEFFGEFGAGKSQVSMMAALKTPLPVEQGGLDGNVIYIDTEGTFRPERIKSICENLGYDWEQVLSKIHRVRLDSSSKLIVFIRDKLIHKIQETKARLVVIDSVISLFRAEKIGRGTLALRQQVLGELLHKLSRTIEVYNCACILTNQVQSKVDGYTFPGSDGLKPTGGNVLGHASTYRVRLRKSGKKKTATMEDSPNKDYEAVPFMVTANGIEDFVENKKVTKDQAKEEDTGDDKI
jgi:DNA repair protein RadA